MINKGKSTYQSKYLLFEKKKKIENQIFKFDYVTLWKKRRFSHFFKIIILKLMNYKLKK